MQKHNIFCEHLCRFRGQQLNHKIFGKFGPFGIDFLKGPQIDNFEWDNRIQTFETFEVAKRGLLLEPLQDVRKLK